MKHKLSFFAILLMALALPQSVRAYRFSTVAPSGQTLYYNFVNGGVEVTYPGSGGTWDGYTEPTGALEIPSSVTYYGNTYSVIGIDGDAFYSCTGLTSVTIPNTVTSIGRWAFARCFGLTSVTIPNTVTSIGDYAFQWVWHIEYHGTATYSSNNLYWGANSMNGFTDGDFIYSDNTKTTLIQYIGSDTAVVIPSTVTAIGRRAFSCHFLLTSVTIPSTVTSIDEWAFQACYRLTSVTIPSSVTSIGNSAFSSCDSLTSITVASGNPTYDSRNNCNAIIETATNTLIAGCQNTIIPNTVTSIGDYAFYDCRGLTGTIPNTVTSIGDYAFCDCSGLTGTIPNSVTSIGDWAFSGCSGLTGSIPNSVTSIGVGTFFECSDLTGALTIGNSVTSIGAYAFAGCSGLTSLTIGNSVTSIGGESFSGCSGLTGALTIPNSVTSIGNHAFSDCSSLTSITIGNSVTSIGYGAFSGCSGLTGALTIPNSVTSIGGSAFSGCSGLTSLTIGNSVDSIGAYAFSDCSGLTSITIGNSVNKIYPNHFAGCIGITSVTFNARNCTIYNYNYNGDSPISGPVSALFGSNNINITSFTFGDNVQGIPDYLCYGMTGLTSITIPNSVTQIGTKAFYDCTALATVVVGNGVSTLSDNTFANCNHMTNLTLGSGLQTIAPAAFAGCNAVLRMTVRASTPPTSTSNPFTAFNTGIPVYVPCNSVSAYQNAPYWGFFTNYQGNFYSFSVAAADPSMGYVNIITQPDCSNHQAHFQANAYNGFHFVRWSDGNTTNPRYLVVSSDVELTALFAPDVQPEFTVSVASADPAMGTVSGGGTYTQGSTATLTATPNSGYRFVRWHDNNTDNPRTVTVTADATYTAYFEAEVGIGDVEWEGIELDLQGSTLTIHGATGEPVTITDLMGRCLYSARATESTHVALPSAGVYFVRVGDRPARKVVAARR